MAIEPLDLVDADPVVVHGQARIRGTRIPVSVVLDCLATEMTEGRSALNIHHLRPERSTPPLPTRPFSPAEETLRVLSPMMLFRSYMEPRGKSPSSVQVADERTRKNPTHEAPGGLLAV